MTKSDLLYEVTVVYPNYTRRIVSVNEPRIFDENGVPVLFLRDSNKKIYKFNMNKVERYEYTMIAKEAPNA